MHSFDEENCEILKENCERLSPGECFKWATRLYFYPNPPFQIVDVEREADLVAKKIIACLGDEFRVNMEIGKMMDGYLGGINGAPVFSEAGVSFFVTRT